MSYKRSNISDVSSHDCDGQIEDHPLVTFLPLDLTNPDSIENVLSHIDYTMQYGEDEEPKEVGTTHVAPVFLRRW